jgi:membrane-bound lytic murein transglycosylase D
MNRLMLTLRRTLPPRPQTRTQALACALWLAAITAYSQQPPQPAPPPAVQTPAQIAATTAHAQQVQQLIARAEASYTSGVANYNANHLDAARTDFDAAVDAMLSSEMDVKNDPQLSDELERLLDAINSLEMIALKQGNGFSPKVEAAPLDAANDVTFSPNPMLVTQVTAELKTTTSDLPLVVNEYVAGWINAFEGPRRGTLKRSLERAGKYKEMISKILRDNGVPQDLIYQAVAESGFQPQALNPRSGAGGMWQFMPFAGAYGLERNGYFDERFDPEKSTEAYAKYMKFLYRQTGDWYLAMASYDWGLGHVQHAVSRTGYADFWELYRHNALPTETKNYVPGILAAIIMAKNPQQYGLSDMVPDAPVLSDKVTTSYSISLPLVADLTNSVVPEIVALNPALLRLSTPRDIPYDLHLPPGTRQVYLDRLKDIPEDNRDSWRFHVVKDGETLNDIATAMHASAAQIATVNGVTSAEPIGSGDELVIPIAASSASTGQQRYTLRRGDTLVTVADRFGVSVEQLRLWNRLASNRVTPGRTLYVVEPVRLAPGMRSSHRRRGSSHGSSRGSTATSRSHTKLGATHGTAHTTASHGSKKKRSR